METVLIDTNILIGRIRNEPRTMAALEKVAGQPLVLCDVVVAEVLAGTRNKIEYNATHRELNKQFHILPFTMEVSQHLRNRNILAYEARDPGGHFADQLIAATAMAHDRSLLTLNQKHVKGIKGLKTCANGSRGLVRPLRPIPLGQPPTSLRRSPLILYSNRASAPVVSLGASACRTVQ